MYVGYFCATLDYRINVSILGIGYNSLISKHFYQHYIFIEPTKPNAPPYIYSDAQVPNQLTDNAVLCVLPIPCYFYYH